MKFKYMFEDMLKYVNDRRRDKYKKVDVPSPSSVQTLPNEPQYTQAQYDASTNAPTLTSFDSIVSHFSDSSSSTYVESPVY